MKCILMCLLGGFFAISGFGQSGDEEYTGPFGPDYYESSLRHKEAFSKILPLETRKGEDVVKLMASVTESGEARSNKLRDQLVPDSISFLLATFYEYEDKGRTGYISPNAIWEKERGRFFVSMDEKQRIKLMTEKLKKDGTLCSFKDIKKLIWNDKHKTESFGSFSVETGFGVKMDCLFRGRKVGGKSFISEVYIDPAKIPGKFEAAIKILDVDWKLNGITFAQKEAFEDLSCMELTGEYNKNVISIYQRYKQKEYRERILKQFGGSLTFLFPAMKPWVVEDGKKDRIKGAVLNGVHVDKDLFMFEQNIDNGTTMAVRMARKMSEEATINSVSLFNAGDFTNVDWKNPTAKKSSGSFTLTSDFGISMDCLFKASNKDGRIQIEKVAICSRKEPKSFDKAITIIDRTK